jgi:capsular exopolysaccharide synthesis family protein
MEQTMELLEYWKIFRKRLWLIVLLMVIGGGSAFFYTSQQVPQYQTSTTLFINPGEISPLIPAGFAPTNNRVESLANTYIELMQTRSFVRLVQRELESTVGEGTVRSSLSSMYVEGTQFFRISATHTDPQVAQNLANTAATVLIARELERQQSEQQQIEARRGEGALTQSEKQRFVELIEALEAELTYYDGRIQETEDEIDALNQTSNKTEAEEERMGKLISLLPELRYARLDVQSRLADAQYSLSSLDNEQEVLIDTAVVVDKALVPATPLPRNRLQNTLLAAMVGAMVGAGLAMLLEYIDYTIKTPETLDMVYGIPTQGVIGSLSEREHRRKGGYLVTLGDSISPTAEAFRALRTGIQVAGLNTSLRSLLVTSAGPGEGKTFVAANLAASLALNGYRVILVDADLRKPSLHKIFDLPRESGFTTLMMRQEAALTKSVLQTTSIPNLHVLTCGPIPPNPSELLGSAQAHEMMQAIEALADIVIYDSPPVATVTDAALLAQRVDGVLHVVWAGHTRINLVQRSKAILEQVGARILGPVLNQVQTGDLGYYSYYYSYGYYHHHARPYRQEGLRLPPMPGQRRAPRIDVVDMDTLLLTGDESRTNGIKHDGDS